MYVNAKTELVTLAPGLRSSLLARGLKRFYMEIFVCMGRNHGRAEVFLRFLIICLFCTAHAICVHAETANIFLLFLRLK